MKRAVPFLIAALSLTGCSSMAQTKPVEKDSCNSADACVVTIKVTGCSDKEITATPDILKVKRGYKGDITWKIDGADKWAFAAEGIAFKDTKLASTQFTEKRPGKRDYRWYDKNSGPGEFRYAINLTSPDGKACSKDPTIMNDQNP